MEDSHIANVDIGDGVALFAVFDGHGGKFSLDLTSSVLGSEVAKYVAKNYLKELKKTETFKKKDYKRALEESFVSLDAIMQSPAGKKDIDKLMKQFSPDTHDPNVESMAGATANVLLITKTDIYCANCGDSRSVLSKKGKAKELSIDHKPNLPNEKRRIERAGGYVDDNRVNGMLALSRAFGDFEYKRDKNLKPSEQIVSIIPDITVEKIAADCEFIVCACDGIWDCMDNQQCVTWFSKNLKAKASKK